MDTEQQIREEFKSAGFKFKESDVKKVNDQISNIETLKKENNEEMHRIFLNLSKKCDNLKIPPPVMIDMIASIEEQIAEFRRKLTQQVIKDIMLVDIQRRGM